MYGWVVYVSGSLVVPVIVPEQSAVVIGAVAVAEHSGVTSAKVGITGAVTSSMTHVLSLSRRYIAITIIKTPGNGTVVP